RNGAMAINNSWGGPGAVFLPTIPNTFLLPTLVSEAIEEVATNGRGGLGSLVVFAAGNETLPVSFGNIYGTVRGVMNVGAVMSDDRVRCYSNCGRELSVMAPGGGVSATAQFAKLGSLLLNCYDSDITTT